MRVSPWAAAFLEDDESPDSRRVRHVPSEIRARIADAKEQAAADRRRWRSAARRYWAIVLAGVMLTFIFAPIGVPVLAIALFLALCSSTEANVAHVREGIKFPDA